MHIDANGTTSDRIGFYCSALLLSLLFVLILLGWQGFVSSEREAFAVTAIILIVGPYVLLFASFCSWILLYLNHCRKRYHAVWLFVAVICFGVLAYAAAAMSG